MFVDESCVSGDGVTRFRNAPKSGLRILQVAEPGCLPRRRLEQAHALLLLFEV